MFIFRQLALPDFSFGPGGRADKMSSFLDSDLPLWRLPVETGDAALDVEHLLSFVDQLYHPVVQRSFYVQLYFCIALAFVILLLASSAIGHRIFTGRAWFIRRTHVSSGTFYIPNSVMTFLTCQGIFVALWIVYSLISTRFYENKGYQKDYLLWRALVWVPLWDGGWFTGFGIFSAFPDALKSKKGNLEKQHRSIFSPLVFNVACWVTPIFQLASLLPPAVLAARHYNASLSNFELWRVSMATAEAATLTSQDVDNARRQIITFWQQVVHSYRYYGIAMTCWSAWALICLAVYVPVGAHTLHRIRKQLKLARSNFDSTKRAAMAVHFRETPHEVVVAVQQPYRQEQQSSSTSVTHNGRLANDTCDSGARKNTRDSLSRFRTTLAAAAAKLPSARMDNTDLSMTVEERRISNLRRVYRNLSVQYYGISVAISCFFISAILQATDGYVSAQQNDIGMPQVVGNLLAGWVTVLFSFLIIFCIFWRSFDPALNVEIEDEQRVPIITRAKLATLKKRALHFAAPRLYKTSVHEGCSQEQSAVSGNDSMRADVSHSSPIFAGGSEKSSPHRMKAILPSRGSSSLPEYPSLYYATPYGKVPAAPAGARLVENRPDRSKSLPHKSPPNSKHRGAAEVRRPPPSCNLLAEHGSAYKPAASSYGQWRQTYSSPPHTPPPARSSTPLLTSAAVGSKSIDCSELYSRP